MGGQPVTLPINEIFETIQGEGYYTGRASIFIRMQGCPVGCPWCDTKHTWDVAPGREIDRGEMMTKDAVGDDRWAFMDVADIEAQLQEYRSRHVVITGGEPAMHDLSELTTRLIERGGRSVQIETSGTYPVRCHPLTWVTVAPKIDMPGGRPIDRTALARANEIKMPVGKPEDILALHRLISSGDIDPDALISVSPLSLSRKATDLCIANAIANNWRLSVQTHAMLHIR
jgi:7-carboxy-7-deazaguanine synthase